MNQKTPRATFKLPPKVTPISKKIQKTPVASPVFTPKQSPLKRLPKTPYRNSPKPKPSPIKSFRKKQLKTVI